MPPVSSRRKYNYGSLSPHQPSGGLSFVDGSDRFSLDFDPSPSRRQGQRDGGAGWRFFGLVAGALVGAICGTVGLSRSGHLLLNVITDSRETNRYKDNSPGQGFVNISNGNGVVANGGNDKAAVQPPLSGEFSIVVPSRPEQQMLPPLDFTALNSYHVRDGKPALDYPWLKDVKLIEPFRETTLSVTPPRKGFAYRWVVHDPTSGRGDRRVEASGEEVTVVFTNLHENIVTLEEVDQEAEVVVRRLEEKVMVKYVRREIRTLMDDERQDLFDAMHTLWTVRVDGGDGKELYGDDYADIFAINRLHFKASSPVECDHFHEGLGFLTSHAVVSNTFEASLQAVNPKLTLPYWDFTIETSSAGGSGNSSTNQPQTKSPLFQHSWFGTVDPVDDQVKDGRWAYTEIPPMMHNNPGRVEPDVYSKLRAPWNVNNRPYMTRGMGKMCGAKTDELYPWPTCEMHYDLVTSYHDFYSWVWYAMYDPHGPVHVWLGGVLDCEETYTAIAALVGPDRAEELALYSYIHRKGLFRDGLFSCTGTASVEETPLNLFASGQCGCPGYDLTQGDDYEIIYDAMVDMSDIIGDFDPDVRRQVVAALCTTTMSHGEHLQASSSIDPSFYPTHPTVERTWMYAVLTGQIKDYTWPDSDVTVTKAGGTTVSEAVSLFGDTCEGHRGSDVFPFGLLDGDTNGFEIKTGVKGESGGNTLTNRELLAQFDPRIDSLPYVYDTFKWKHCSDDGFDFDDAWGNKEATTPPERRTQFEEGIKKVPMYNIFKKIRAERGAKKGGTPSD